jgi:RND family efflux transporter MFP subunit
MSAYRFFAAGLAVLGCGLAGCGREEPAGAPGDAPRVTVSVPVERDVTDYKDFTGRTQAVETVDVRARVWGYLMRINFTDGQEVRKGDVLFKIDPRIYQAELDRAQAAVTSAQAQLAFTDAEYERELSLYRSKAASAEEVESALRDRDRARAQLGVTQADAAQRQLDLSFTDVTAPISGRVSRTQLTLGNLIQGGQANATLLTTIVSLDPMYVYFNIDEQTALHIQQMTREHKFATRHTQERDKALNTASLMGMLGAGTGRGPLLAAASLDPARRYTIIPVFLGLASERDYPHQGNIDFVDNKVNPATGTIQVRGVFRNRDRVLSAGLFARVRLPLGAPHPALLVTDRAFGTDQGQKFAYVVNDKNEVVPRPVTLGQVHDGLRVVETGLRAAERVIINGLQRVRPGVVVDPRPGEMLAEAPRPGTGNGNGAPRTPATVTAGTK